MKIHKALLLLTTLTPTLAIASTPGEVRREIALELASKSEIVAYNLADNNYTQSLDSVIKALPKNKYLNKLSNLANNSAISKYGIQGYAKSVMQVRLVRPAIMEEDKEPLISYIPDGDEREWSAIEAFDKDGNTVYLDVYQQPNRSIVVIGTDNKKIKEAGLSLLKERLGDSINTRKKYDTHKADDAETLRTSILKRIRLETDQEPWILGKAEVYAVVAGVSAEQDKANLDIIDMPYLDEDGKDYYPNQVLVYWDKYRWGVADVLLFEQDAGYNYKDLAKALLEFVGEGLELGGVHEAKPFIGIGQKILDSMKDSWFQNDDDYVDSFYVLEHARSYNSYMGANGNALISLQPREFSLK